MKNVKQGLRKGTGSSLALGASPSGKCFLCSMGNGEVHSKVWDLPAAPDSLVFGPAAVQGRSGLLTPLACLCRVVWGLPKAGLGREGRGCVQSLQVPCPCPANGFISTDFPPDTIHTEGAVMARAWEEGRYLGPRRDGSVDLVFVFSPDAKTIQYYKSSHHESSLGARLYVKMTFLL